MVVQPVAGHGIGKYDVQYFQKDEQNNNSKFDPIFSWDSDVQVICQFVQFHHLPYEEYPEYYVEQDCVAQLNVQECQHFFCHFIQQLFFKTTNTKQGTNVINLQFNILIMKHNIKRTENKNFQNYSHVVMPEEQNIQESQSSIPFKPFHYQFRKLKTEETLPLINEQTFDSPKINDYVKTKRILTEEQTNEQYQFDFQIEEESPSIYQTVQQQNQNAQDSSPSQFKTKEHSNLPEKYRHLTAQHLHFLNQQLIKNIQFFRENLQIYKINIEVLNQQYIQLKNLRNQKERAFDYSYQLNLDRSTQIKNRQGRQKNIQVRHASIFQKKMKYSHINASLRKTDSTSFDLQIQEVKKQKAMKKFAMKREDIYCKKKLSYQYEDKIELLDEKIKSYKSILNNFDKILCGDQSTLFNRKSHLQHEILLKKTMISINEIELNSQIGSINNQITRIEARIMTIRKSKKQIKEEIAEDQDMKQQTDLVHLSVAQKKKSSNFKMHSLPSVSKPTIKKKINSVYSPSNYHSKQTKSPLYTISDKKHSKYS